jgi:hypothetical protein
MGAAAAPILIGSAIGAVANRRNPLQGALLGGALGGIGGSVLGGAQTLAGSKLAAPAGTSALAGAGSSAYMPVAGSGVAGGGSAYFPVTGMSAVPTSGTPLAQGIVTAATPAASPTFMQTVSEIPKAFQSFTGENPVLTQMTLMGAQNALQTPPRPQANPNLMRGSPIPQQAQRFQANVPQVSLI